MFPCQLRLFRDLFELVWSSCLLYPSHLTRTIVLLVVCRHKLLTLHLFLARTLNTDKSPVQPCHHPLLQVPRDLFKVSISLHDQYIACYHFSTPFLSVRRAYSLLWFFCSSNSTSIYFTPLPLTLNSSPMKQH